MTDTPAETMQRIWGRFHDGEQGSFETLLPLFWLRQQAREAEYGRYYRKLERLAMNIELTASAGPNSSPG